MQLYILIIKKMENSLKSLVVLFMFCMSTSIMVCSCNSDDNDNLRDPLVSVFAKKDLLQTVHEGDNMVITSLTPSYLISIREKYNSNVSDAISVENRYLPDVRFHWLHIRQSTDSTYIINIERPEPNDTVRHLEVQCIAAPVPMDNVITFDYD